MQAFAYPITWISLAYLFGIILARYVEKPVEFWLNAMTGAMLVALAGILTRAFYEKRQQRKRTSEQPEASLKREFLFYLPMLLLAFFFGSYHFQKNQPVENDPFSIEWFTDREYEMMIVGIISDPPDYRDTYTNLTIDVKHIDRPDKKNHLYVHGKILVRVNENETYHYGDYIRVRGILETPPENEEFSYKDYLALSGIHAYMSRATATFLPEERGGLPFMAAIYDLRDKSLANIHQIFPDPEASLLAGILLGIETGLPRDLQEAFKNTGTTHIIAISGFNITIIAGIFITLFGNLFGKKIGGLIALFGIAVYTIFVGADAAVVRAALMGGLGLWGRNMGRRQDGIASLLLVAIIMAYFNSMVLWDVGFQLSFAATFGLIAYAQPLTDWFVRFTSRFMSEEKALTIAGPVGEYFLFTLAAQFATIPIMAYHFGRISIISFIANPFILPVQPAVMIIGGLALIGSLILFPLGQILAIFALPFTTYTIRMVEFFAPMPNGVIVLGDTKLETILLVYLIMLAWTFGRESLKKHTRGFMQPAFVASILFILSIQIWRIALASPDGNLHITFFDAGSAEAILIQSPSGRNLLINGGESISDLSSDLGSRLPLFQRNFDWLIVASTRDEDLAALPRVLERFPAEQVLWGGNREASYASRALEEYIVKEKIPMTIAEKGQSLMLEEGVEIKIQAVGTRGAVLLIEWDSFRALLPVGMDFQTIDETKTLRDISLLLLADSGYAPINPPLWIDDLHPQLVVLSVAADDRFGLPHTSVLESVKDYSLLRTDKDGWIHIATDGSQMWVDRENADLASFFQFLDRSE